MKLAIHSVLIAIGLLVVYEGTFRVLGRTYMPREENMPVANFMHAQRYIYDRPDAPVIIVGSSIANRLRGDLLPPDMVNLSFGGMSALDGMNVVVKAGTRPQTVLVETNALSRGFNREFAMRLLNPVLLEARRRMVSLRDVARPLTVGLSYFQGGINRAKRMFFASPSPGRYNAVALSRNSDGAALFTQLLAILKNENRDALTKTEQEELVAILSGFTDALEQRGISIVFFEMPTHPIVCESPRLVSLRQLIRERFPARRYMRIGNCDDSSTVDGVHLTVGEAARVTGEFVTAVGPEPHPH